MWWILAGVASWLFLLFMVLAVCRAGARADEQAARDRRRLRRRSGVAATLALLATTGPQPPAAEARASCPNAALPFEEAPDRARRALVCEIDRVRERHGRDPLVRRGALDAAAERHAADMVERSFFSHVSPGGAELADRLRRSGYAAARCSWAAGEVLAWGTGARSAAAATVDSWLESPGHRAVLLRSRYADVGVGLAAGTPERGSDDGVTSAALLGRREC